MGFIERLRNSNETIDILRWRRLDQATTDHEFAQEVLAVLLQSKQSLLESYIEQKLASIEPAEQARGIMALGFSDQSERNTRQLRRFSDEPGLIGQAHAAAQKAYERNCWARYWWEKMCQTDCPKAFWQAQVLFRKIVDRRFCLWRDVEERSGSLIRNFEMSATRDLSNRYDRWKKDREKELFGRKAPMEIFVVPPRHRIGDQ